MKSPVWAISIKLVFTNSRILLKKIPIRLYCFFICIILWLSVLAQYTQYMHGTLNFFLNMCSAVRNSNTVIFFQPIYIILLLLLTDGSDTWNRIFGYPESVKKMSCKTKLSKVFLHFLSNFFLIIGIIDDFFSKFGIMPFALFNFFTINTYSFLYKDKRPELLNFRVVLSVTMFKYLWWPTLSLLFEQIILMF